MELKKVIFAMSQCGRSIITLSAQRLLASLLLFLTLLSLKLGIKTDFPWQVIAIILSNDRKDTLLVCFVTRHSIAKC